LPKLLIGSLQLEEFWDWKTSEIWKASQPRKCWGLPVMVSIVVNCHQRQIYRWRGLDEGKDLKNSKRLTGL
jgi:hypothetical protein